MKIKMLPAYHGDSFIISIPHEETHKHIIVDGGISRTYIQTLEKELRTIERKGEKVNLLIVTHTDDDHIGGILKLFEDISISKEIIERVIFNSAYSLAQYFNTQHKSERELILKENNCNASHKQAITLERELERLGLLPEKIYVESDTVEIGEANITILSPRLSTLKELNINWERESISDVVCSRSDRDYRESIETLKIKLIPYAQVSLANRSSIAFLITWENRKILMLGDAEAQTIVESLKRMGYSHENRLVVDSVKLSHHGSINNINEELMKMLKCSNFMISTNGARHGHPDKQTLAKILYYNTDVTFYFNYDIVRNIFTNDEINNGEFKINLNKLISYK